MKQPISSGPLLSQGAIRSVPWVFINKIINTLVNIFISLFIVRSMGAVGFGQYTIVHHLASYAMIFASVGLNSAILRYISIWKKQEGAVSLTSMLKLLIMELVGWFVLTLIFYLCQGIINQIFDMQIDNLWFIISILLLAYLVKEWAHNFLTALYAVNYVALFNCIYGLLSLGLFYGLWIYNGLSITTVIYTLSLALLISAFIVIYQLQKEEVVIKRNGFKNGIEYKSMFKLSLPLMSNTALTKVLQQYSEVFFLGALIAPKVAGYYSLAYETTFMMICMIPLSMHALMMSAVSESYTKDSTSLPHVICSVYRFLILICLPLTAITFFFFPQILQLVYGNGMEPAARVGSWISLMHLLGLFSIPISIGIFAKQDVHKTVFFQFAVVILNICLDILLIKKWALMGACLAFVLTFFITLSWRIKIVSRSIGGVYFPIYYFISVSLACFMGAGLIWMLTLSFSYNWVPLKALLAGLVIIVLLRMGAIVDEPELEFFSSFSKPIYRLVRKVLVRSV